MTRCRIVHGRLTHIYLLNNEERPECIPSNSNHSIKHVFIHCVDVDDVRQNIYNVNKLCDLFTNVADDTMYNFCLKKFIYIHKYSYITYVLNI